MRICIPTETDAAKGAKVCEHYGSAPYFTVYDSHNDTWEVFDNLNQHHMHGTCQPMTIMSGKNIDAVACRGMGARAVLRFNKKGTKVYKVVVDIAEEIVAQFMHGGLEEITIEQACRHHDCH